MDEEELSLPRTIADMAAPGSAAIEGVFALMAQLAKRGFIDRADIERVGRHMKKRAEIATVIKEVLLAEIETCEAAALEVLGSGDISGPPDKKGEEPPTGA